MSAPTTIERIVQAYEQFRDEHGLTRVATLEEIRAKDGNLSIPLYVASTAPTENGEKSESTNLVDVLESWLESSARVQVTLADLIPATKN